MKSQPIEPENSSQKHGLLASRDQNTTFDAQYRLAWLRANRWNFLIVLLTVGILIPLIGASMSRTPAYKQEIPNTPAYYGQAYVTSKTIIAETKNSPVSYGAVIFRLNGKQITASTFDRAKWIRTPTNATVPVTYHVGDNGGILISDWQIPPAK